MPWLSRNAIDTVSRFTEPSDNSPSRHTDSSLSQTYLRR